MARAELVRATLPGGSPARLDSDRERRRRARDAVGGPARYVRVSGRVDAEDEFEDDAHRPLVLRRTRLQVRDGRDWHSIEDRREAVPFSVRDGLDAIAIDSDALDAGLVVIPARIGRDGGRRAGSRAGGDSPGDTGPPARRAGVVGRARDRPGRPVARPGRRAADDRRPRPTAGPHDPRARTRRCGSWRGRTRAVRSWRPSASPDGLVLISLGLAWAVIGAVAVTRDRALSCLLGRGALAGMSQPGPRAPRRPRPPAATRGVRARARSRGRPGVRGARRRSRSGSGPSRSRSPTSGSPAAAGPDPQSAAPRPGRPHGRWHSGPSDYWQEL